MVFSIFGRKEKSDSRKGKDAAAARSSDGVPVANSPSSEMQREIARQTAEKIDRIESEMIASGLPVPPPPKRVQGIAPHDMVPAPSRAEPAAQVHGSAPQAVNGLGGSTSIALGDTAHAGEIHINGSNLPPELEEAAILFANGQMPAAETTLRQAIRNGSLGAGSQQAWLMLFDIYLNTGQKEAFEDMSLDYAAKFELSPPSWRENIRQSAEQSKTAVTGANVLFGANVDGKLEKQFEQMKRAAASKKPAVLEFVSVQKIDNAGAAALLRAIETFKSGKHEMVIANAAKMFEAAKLNIETGRRDDNQSSWMLALEMLRAQGLKQKFDDMSIDYCVTYEVSPPSWEPMPAWIRGDVVQATNTQIVASADAAGEAGAFSLTGELVGRMQSELASLRVYAQDRHDLVIDCRGLSRLDFVAAGELLNEVVTLRNMGKSVVFVEPNYLVLALMKVMGIHELADIRRPN